jgi:hypothetical protein
MNSIQDISARAQGISRFRKERFLREMSEDRFRDEVVRPLFLRKGLKDGRELCGITEEGKDCLFFDQDRLGVRLLYVVQTKKGDLNLAKRAQANIIEAETQMKTALQTQVPIVSTRERIYPDYAILCTSGKINSAARHYLLNSIHDPRLRFVDKDDLIPEIDEYYAELWLGIDANKLPYLRGLRDDLLKTDGIQALGDLLPSSASPIADDSFVGLHLFRIKSEIKKYKGKVFQEPKYEQIPLSGVLSKKDHLFLILGEAGSGKSTSLRRLAFITANRGISATNEQEIEIPIILRAVDISKADQKLIDICISETIKLSPSGKPCFKTEDLNAGKVLIFVDALDEISADADRKDVLNRIKQFYQQYPLCRIILTSRDYSFIKELEELIPYKTYRISPIDWKEADRIIRRLQSGKSLPKEDIQEMLRRLQDVHGIELNPLLVTVFVATSDYSRTDIPANITELFKKFTEMMLGRWDSSKGLSQQYQHPLKDFLLQKLAFEMHRRRITSLPLMGVEGILKYELERRGISKADIKILIDEMLYRSGLFRFVGEDAEFRHLLIQEFFAGRGIPKGEFLQSIISDQWWQRAIVFYFGQNPADHESLESLTSEIGPRPSRDIFQSALTVGLALQASYLVLVEQKTNILMWVIEMLASSKEVVFNDKQTKLPLSQFLAYYLFGRDSVACNILKNKVGDFIDAWDKKEMSPEDKDLHIFWSIVGLIECGCLKEAEKITKKYRPSDERLLLAIHMGCFLVANLRVISKEEKEIAGRIMENIQPRIQHLRISLLKEIKTELLEVQRGEIKRIGVPE